MILESWGEAILLLGVWGVVANNFREHKEIF